MEFSPGGRSCSARRGGELATGEEGRGWVQDRNSRGGKEEGITFPLALVLVRQMYDVSNRPMKLKKLASRSFMNCMSVSIHRTNLVPATFAC